MSKSNRYAVVSDPTDEEVKKFQQGLESYNMEKTNREFDSPQPWHNLILKNKEGEVIGGTLTSTLYWTQYLEVLWVDEKHRGLGYGRDLVIEAQKLAKEIGCISSHVYTFSWQAPEFYQAVGYDLIVTYDGYHSGIKEHVLMTRLDSLDDRITPKAGPDRFAITSDPSEEEIKTVRAGLGRNFDKHAKKNF